MSVEFPIAAAERAAQLAELIAEVRKVEERDVTRLERELRSVRDRAAAAVAELEREARAVHERLEAALLAEWRDAIDELVARHDGRDRSVARAIGELVVSTSERCTEELGVEFHAARHLALAFARREIERKPHAINRFGLQDAWSDGPLGPGLIASAEAVVQGSTEGDVLLLAELNALELAAARQAASARGGEPERYASERFSAMHVGADAGAWRRALEEFEAEWRERERQRQAAELERHRAEIRRARAGDVTVSESKPVGWFNSVRRFANEQLFGPVLPVSNAPARVAADDDANDPHLAAIRRVERQAAEAAARKGA